MMIFLFHLLITLLLIPLLLHLSRENKVVLVSVLGIALLFIIHCTVWQDRCMSCNLSSWICLMEMVLFWLFVALGLYGKFYKGRKG